MVEWFSSCLAEQEVRGLIPGLATWISEIGYPLLASPWSRDMAEIPLKRHKSSIHNQTTNQHRNSLCNFVSDFLDKMYPVELKIKDITESNTSASFVDCVGRLTLHFHFMTSLRDDFNFHITNFPFLSSNIPGFARLWRLYLLASSPSLAYTICPDLRATGLWTGIHQGTLKIFYGQYGDLFK